MKRLTSKQTDMLAKVYEEMKGLEKHEKTSYTIVIKEEKTGFELPYGALTQQELETLTGTLEPHKFFCGHEWYSKEN